MSAKTEVVRAFEPVDHVTLHRDRHLDIPGLELADIGLLADLATLPVGIPLAIPELVRLHKALGRRRAGRDALYASIGRLQENGFVRHTVARYPAGYTPGPGEKGRPGAVRATQYLVYLTRDNNPDWCARQKPSSPLLPASPDPVGADPVDNSPSRRSALLPGLPDPVVPDPVKAETVQAQVSDWIRETPNQSPAPPYPPSLKRRDGRKKEEEELPEPGALAHTRAQLLIRTHLGPYVAAGTPAKLDRLETRIAQALEYTSSDGARWSEQALLQRMLTDLERVTSKIDTIIGNRLHPDSIRRVMDYIAPPAIHSPSLTQRSDALSRRWCGDCDETTRSVPTLLTVALPLGKRVIQRAKACPECGSEETEEKIKNSVSEIEK